MEEETEEDITFEIIPCSEEVFEDETDESNAKIEELVIEPVEEYVEQEILAERAVYVLQHEPSQESVMESHSYPRPTSEALGRKRGRVKAPELVDQNIQVNFSGKRTQIGFHKTVKRVVRVVDVGTQVTDADFDPEEVEYYEDCEV